MPEPTIYAVKAVEDRAPQLFESLKQGEARYGWSYTETADLRKLAERIETQGWDSLTDHEKDCNKEFLLKIDPGDYLVYINLPSWGKCTLCRVNKPYNWRWEDDDFNHRLGVDPESIKTFDRNDLTLVHPALSARLKLQGSWWRISTKKEFHDLLAALSGEQSNDFTSASTPNLGHLSNEIKPLLQKITRNIHRTHPNTSLEGLMCEVLRKMPNVQDVSPNGGAGDKGADILVTVEDGHPLTSDLKLTLCVVQVKSFEGEHWDTRAAEDIRRAFNAYPEAEAGVIVSTASKSGQTLEDELDKLKEETGKHVSLLIGENLALFFLKYGSNLIKS